MRHGWGAYGGRCETRAISAVLHILPRFIEAHLRRSSDASSQARFGAVSFIHRVGASLNRHVHYHRCVIDGVSEPVEEPGDYPRAVRFRSAAELTPRVLDAIAEQMRVRVLRWFARSGLISVMTSAKCSSGRTATSRSMPGCA